MLESSIPAYPMMKPCTNPSRFQQSLLKPDSFTLTFELVPSRGGWTKEHARILCLARQLAHDGRIQAVSITENAGGHPALSPEVLGQEIMKMGLDVIGHFSCKDKNRNQIESLLFSLDRQGLHNLLVITGDYPKKGYRGYPKPVFDLDSTQLLDLIARMNAGMIGIRRAGKGVGPIEPTSFFNGVAVSPFKLLEAEIIMQYLKLQRKIAHGAHFGITQVGYDPRKFQELIYYLQDKDLTLPLLGNVFIPSPKVAEIMFRGDIPGCVLPEGLYQQMQREWGQPDGGRQAALDRGARLMAVLKGLGYAGAHIGGPSLSMKEIDYLLTTAQAHETRWLDSIEALTCWPTTAFFYFRRDSESGLNLRERVLPRQQTAFQFSHALAKVMHRVLFIPTGPLYRAMKTVCTVFAGTRLERVLKHSEYVIKALLFHCQDCGDCTLAELAFLCPQWGCAKYILNGPCGGSRDGWCEVHPGKKRCLYVRLYERLTPGEVEAAWPRAFVPPRDWALNGTSSWVNYFQCRDHTVSGEEKNISEKGKNR